MRTEILGVGFDNLTKAEALAQGEALLNAHSGGFVVTPNPEIVMLCRENAALKEAVDAASLVLADGIGIIYGAKILGTPMKGRNPGIDFGTALMQKMGEHGQSVFLFGAKPGVAEQAAEKILELYPGIVIAGTNDGYFQDDAPIIAKINAAKPDLLLVCLGAPKQELWMRTNQDKLDVGLMIGLGGSLDVFAGVVKRAPEIWQKLGLEWLYRLLREPKRFFRMMKLPQFLLVVIGQRLRGKKGQNA